MLVPPIRLRSERSLQRSGCSWICVSPVRLPQLVVDCLMVRALQGLLDVVDIGLFNFDVHVNPEEVRGLVVSRRRLFVVLYENQIDVGPPSLGAHGASLDWV